MCALFGWLDYKGMISQKTLRKLTQSLANAAEERGTDASGISYIKDGRVTIYKRPKPAHKIRFSIPDRTCAVMGHTRMTTQGNEKFNQNNHPFYGHADKDFAFAHNGVLYNDMELRKKKQLPKTHIETDSYVAVQLIEKFGKLNFDSLKAMAEDVKGSFCFTVLDEGNTLYIIKGSNPMCLLHFEELGLYVYASTESIMKKALKKTGFAKIPFYQIETTEGDILRIENNGNISRSKFEVKENFRCGKWYSWYNAYEDEDIYNEHEQMLLEICGCYGACEEDVIMLLEYGYTADEIEDMICDHSLLAKAIREMKGEEDYYKYLISV